MNLNSKITMHCLDDSELKHISRLNAKNVRMYSRQVKWMFEALYELNVEEKIKKYDPYRVGIYTAGPGFVVPKEVIQARMNGHSINSSMRQHYNPKHGFKHNLGICPAHISIHYGIRGPTNAIYNYPFAGQSLIQKAQFDFDLKNIDASLILVSNIIEEPHHVAYQSYYEKNQEIPESLNITEGIWAYIAEGKIDYDFYTAEISKYSEQIGYITNLKKR